jgi:hypothetical protein
MSLRGLAAIEAHSAASETIHLARADCQYVKILAEDDGVGIMGAGAGATQIFARGCRE